MMFFNRKRKHYPAFYREYLERIDDEGFSSDIISLDIETDGLNPKKNDILSFGALHITDSRIEVSSEYYETFATVNQDQELIKIHELISIKGENDFETYIPHLVEMISNRTILGHFIELDLSFINYSLKKMKLPKLKNPVHDTLIMALKKDRVTNYERTNREDYSLYALCRRFGIDVYTTHNAMADAYLTSLVYLHLK